MCYSDLYNALLRKKNGKFCNYDNVGKLLLFSECDFKFLLTHCKSFLEAYLLSDQNVIFGDFIKIFCEIYSVQYFDAEHEKN